MESSAGTPFPMPGIRARTSMFSSAVVCVWAVNTTMTQVGLAPPTVMFSAAWGMLTKVVELVEPPPVVSALNVARLTVHEPCTSCAVASTGQDATSIRVAATTARPPDSNFE
jgi:hypothetical protein